MGRPRKQPPLEIETYEERLARKIKKAFPEPSRSIVGDTLTALPYTCAQCDRSFQCKSSIDKHLWFHVRREVAMHSEPAPRGEEFQCAECGALFRIRDTFLTHMRTHLSFPCTRSCRLVYSSKASLTEHALIRHSRRLLHTWLRDEREARIWKVDDASPQQ